MNVVRGSLTVLMGFVVALSALSSSWAPGWLQFLGASAGGIAIALGLADLVLPTPDDDEV